MRTRAVVWTAAALAVTLAGGGALLADTLVLRNGKQVEGELISVRGDSIEFEEEAFYGGRRTYDRDDVLRIELGRSRHGRGDDDDRDRPPGMREREVMVDSDEPWTDTRIEVRSGQTVYFKASGKVRWGPDRSDGPGGESGSPRNPNRPIPSKPAAALIGRIDDDAPFFIGDEEGPFRMRSSGRLSLGVNDDYLQDNRGSFRVIVSY